MGTGGTYEECPRIPAPPTKLILEPQCPELNHKTIIITTSDFTTTEKCGADKPRTITIGKGTTITKENCQLEGLRPTGEKRWNFNQPSTETETISFTIPTTDGWTKFFTNPIIFYIIIAAAVIVITAIACVCLAYAYKKRRARRNNLRDYEMTVRRNAQSREYEDSRPTSANYPLVRSAQASAMRRQR